MHGTVWLVPAALWVALVAVGCGETEEADPPPAKDRFAQDPCIEECGAAHDACEKSCEDTFAPQREECSNRAGSCERECGTAEAVCAGSGGDWCSLKGQPCQTCCDLSATRCDSPLSNAAYDCEVDCGSTCDGCRRRCDPDGMFFSCGPSGLEHAHLGEPIWDECLASFNL